MSLLSCKEVIVSFDLHGVLFTTDYRLFISTLLKNPHFFRLICYAIRPTVWFYCAYLFAQSSPIEKYIVNLIDKWPGLAPCKDMLIDLANCQKPNNNMVDLAYTLKKQGFTIHIFSNIGTIILADLAKKFPHIIGLFDDIFTTSPEIGYLSKKHIPFFTLYLEHKNLKNKSVILIDDSINNITRSSSIGIYSIHFNNYKETIKSLKQLIAIDNL